MDPGGGLIAARAVLGVRENATAAEIKAAFKSRAALIHPDQHAHRGEASTNAATDAMQQLNAAYQLLRTHARAAVPTRPSGSGLRDYLLSASEPVYYCFDEWNDDRMVETLCSDLRRRGIPYSWVNGELMVERRHTHAVDEIQAAIRADADFTGALLSHYDLRRWPDAAVAAVLAELAERDIGHTVAGNDLTVDSLDEHIVDQLLTSVEELYGIT